MCGGGSKTQKAAPQPTYQYFPEASRTPQQQAAGVVATGAQSQASYGSELSGGAAPAASGMK